MLAVGRWSHQSCCEIGQSIQGQLAKETVGDREIGEVVENLRWKGWIYQIHFLPVWRRGASLVYQNFWVWSILWCSTSDIFGYFTSRIPRICGNHHFGPPSLDGTRLWVWWAKQLFLCREYWLNQGDWTVKSRIGMDEWQLQISSSLGAEKGIDVVCPATYVALKCIVFLESIIFGM